MQPTPFRIEPWAAVLLLSALQMLLGLALWGLFRYYHRHKGHAYLGLWSASFGALTVYLGLSLLALWLAMAWPAAVAARTVVSLVSQFAAYLHVGWLALGAMALQAGQPPPRFLRRAVVAAAVVFALAASLSFAWDGGAAQERIFLRVSLRYLVAAVTYVAVAFALSAVGAAASASGRRAAAAGFAALGVVAALGFLVTAMPDAAPVLTRLSPWIGLLELPVLAATGVGLMFWLHEEERARADAAQREAARLRATDPGTGLPNRSSLTVALDAHLQADQAEVLLLALRLARSRQLRDAFGSEAVDGALRQLAERARSLYPALLVAAARIEDDRLMLAFRIDGNDNAHRLANEVCERIRPPRSEAFLDFFAGYADYPGDSDSTETLVAAAVSAQAAAEHASAARPLAVQRGEAARAREKLELAAQLAAALHGDGLFFEFQPVFDARRGGVAYLEALIRWDHPQRGTLAAPAVIETAQGAGLLPHIDEWAIQAACRHLRQRRATGCEAVPIAINISAQGFLDPAFSGRVATALATSGIDPAQLEIEITEQTAVRDFDRAREVIARLRRLGTTLAIDDFGVGYSSFAQLARLEADRLKIDRAFTAGMAEGRGIAVVAAMVRLGHELGMSVVAEGVETGEQLGLLRSHGVDLLQGFLLSRPLLPVAVDRFLADSARTPAFPAAPV